MSTIGQFLPGGIKSVQTGYVSTNSFTNGPSGEDDDYLDVTIAAVDPNKCMVDVFWARNTDPTRLFTLRLTSATNLRLSSDGLAGTLRCRWYVYEFY